MPDLEPSVRSFFEAYARRMNDALDDPPKVNVGKAREAFADYFVGTDPRSVRGARNGLLFRLMLPRGYRRYRKIGTKRMELRRVEVTQLDDYHAMAQTRWRSLYVKKDGERVEIEFDNIYLLHIPDGGRPKIFAWITGDEEQVLKDHGVT
jgi:hypothetical protein